MDSDSSGDAGKTLTDSDLEHATKFLTIPDGTRLFLSSLLALDFRVGSFCLRKCEQSEAEI